MSNWIFGNSIDSTEEDRLSYSDKFLGYLVNLSHPRCIIAVGKQNFSQEVGRAFPSDAGYFFRNSSLGFELIVTEWLDDTVPSEQETLSMCYSAASHYSVRMQDMLDQAIREDAA